MVIFFFQAEDGIRDKLVTGVQTCALPICTSLASAKGPSVTVGFPPENVTRAPIEGGWSPSSASSTPAFCRDSLYFIIAATALASGIVPGAAFSYPFGIISIMNRIVFLLVFGSELGCRTVSTGANPLSSCTSNEGPRNRQVTNLF